MSRRMQKIQATPEMVALAKEADSIQNACNGCGLAQRFAEVFILLNRMELGTSAVNQHPVIRLWLDKFQSLARIPQDFDASIAAYRLTEKLMAGEDIEYEVVGA